MGENIKVFLYGIVGMALVIGVINLLKIKAVAYFALIVVMLLAIFAIGASIKMLIEILFDDED